MLLLFAFLLSAPLFAREGLQYLNSFPDTDKFISAGIYREETDIEVDEIESSDYEDSDELLVARIVYGQKITKWSWASVELPFIYAEENSLRYGSASRDNFTTRGFREPKLAWNYRFRHKQSDGDYFSDLELGIIPGIFERKAGGPNANGWSGATVANAKLSTGALYDKYEAKLWGEYTYHSWGKGINLARDTKYTSAQYYSLAIFLDLQYMRNEQWYFFVSSGIQFISDYDVKTEGTNSTIQQGTASIGEIGAKYLMAESFITLKYTYQRNDYFTNSRDLGNFRGDFTQEGLTLSWTKNL